MSSSPAPQNLVIIICGPAGSGKTTLCNRLLEEFGNSLRRLVTTTSRNPRPGEVDGVDYHFLKPTVFEERIESGDFIEWAKVHGRYYGSQRVHVDQLLQEGMDILLNIDIQGANAFRHKEDSNPMLAGRLRSIFIKPQSMEQIRERLIARGSDDEEEIVRRLRSAEAEIKAAESFDHTIISGSREDDYSSLKSHYLKLKT